MKHKVSNKFIIFIYSHKKGDEAKRFSFNFISILIEDCCVLPSKAYGLGCFFIGLVFEVSFFTSKL